ncbi:ATP-dependent DNA helicase MER3 [Microbotryomycetes sp. JL201]|nr:ATP-dependent DNA helicase MER3 [Microbotryomycetes sp. JL201]
MDDLEDDVAWAEAFAASSDTTIEDTWQLDGHVDDFGFHHMSGDLYDIAEEACNGDQTGLDQPFQSAPDLVAFPRSRVPATPVPSVTVHRPVAIDPSNFRPASEPQPQQHASSTAWDQAPKPTREEVSYDAFGRQRRTAPQLHADLVAHTNIHAVPALWRFGVLNAVQSVCFDTIFQSDINVVVSAPTGAGKTVLFELAVLRLFSNTLDPNSKVVYMAPTKSLCSERARDWQDKFQRLGLGWTVVEVTGDTSTGPEVWKNVKKAKLIITTPEKFDSVTRKWHDHDSTLAHLRLLCVDECHSVGMDVRGATLEVVVSRMKTLGTRTRIVAVSATIPNIHDLAEWLGAGPESSQPAAVFSFGEEFRPCPLKKIVLGYPAGKDDWQFNSSLNYKLYDLIRQHSLGKPVLVFCNTRKGCVTAAEAIAKDFQKAFDDGAGRLPWQKPPTASKASASDKKLTFLLELGIAFHHAGMELSDRRLVEQKFAASEISIVCATSTLAVGVNLPARMVIIKGTKIYRGNALEELTDMDVLQMIGRAGRPQFDTSGVAVIMTETANKSHFDALVNARTDLESCLHKNLIEHINSEVTLNTIYSLDSALLWLRSTFLYVRIKKNPAYYSLTKTNGSPDARLEAFCIEAIKDLAKHGIIEQGEHHIAATPYGQMMARTFLSKSTFVSIKELPAKSGMRAMLETVSNASEFREVRFRAGEKSIFTKVNKDLKFPVPKLATSADKVMILIQLVLQGIPGADLKTESSNPMMDANLIWPHVTRLVKCLTDILVDRRDGSVRIALELLRSVYAKAWDNSPFVLRQLERIGEKSVKSLADRGISTLEALRSAEPHVLEMALNRNPPYGRKLIAQANAIPAFEIKLELDEQEVVPTEGVTVRLKVSVKIVDTKPPCMTKKAQTPLFAVVLIVTSDYEYIEFRRIRIDQFLRSGEKSFFVSATLVRPSQRVFGCISCDQIAGSETRVDFKPDVRASVFPLPEPTTAKSPEEKNESENDEWDDEAEQAMQEAETRASLTIPKQIAQRVVRKESDTSSAPSLRSEQARGRSDMKFDCNHACKDKTSCRHLCCQQGLDKPPPVRKPRKDTKSKTSTKLSAVAVKKAKLMQSLNDMSRTDGLPARQHINRLPSRRASSNTAKLPSYGNRTIEELLLDSDEGDQLEVDQQTRARGSISDAQGRQPEPTLSDPSSENSMPKISDNSSLPDLNQVVQKQFLPSSSPNAKENENLDDGEDETIEPRRNGKRRAVSSYSSDDDQTWIEPASKLRKFTFNPSEPQISPAQGTSSTVKAGSPKDAAEEQDHLEIDELDSDIEVEEPERKTETFNDSKRLQVSDLQEYASQEAKGERLPLMRADDAEQEPESTADELEASPGSLGSVQALDDDEFDEWLKSCTVVV